MRSSRQFLIGTLCAPALVAVLIGTTAPMAAEQSWNFDNESPGGLPSGWAIAATHAREPLAAWEVVGDEAADGEHVLAMTRIGARAALVDRIFSGSTFNLCWTDGVVFADGEIEVKVRADAGIVDQGGGPIWRAQDGDNYYIARYNPLEANFRLYSVVEGTRRMLADAGNIFIDAGDWFTIRIVHRGNRIEGWLNGAKLLQADDTSITAPGGVGLWTKADALTSFDDLIVRTSP